MDDFDTSRWQPMPQQQKDRVLYVIKCLEGQSTPAAAAALGHSHNYHPRLIQHLKEYGDFAEVEHHRAPVKFTTKVMAAAQQKLLDFADVALTTPQLVQLLEQDGVLTGPTDSHNFLVRFREYLAEEGLTLQVGATRTIFRITEESASERLSVARKLLSLVPNEAALQDFIFEDETTFEESPHPKGECKQVVLRANGWLHASRLASTCIVSVSDTRRCISPCMGV
jgi:hypothetical protein